MFATLQGAVPAPEGSDMVPGTATTFPTELSSSSLHALGDVGLVDNLGCSL